MIRLLKSWWGILLFDLFRYEKAFRLKDNTWQTLCNRNEKISIEKNGVICHWRWSTQLHAPNVIPLWGKRLMKRALLQYPISLSDTKQTTHTPWMTVLIGHRGTERIPLLLQTLRSFAGQKNIAFECIVIEESFSQSIKDILPEWVKYLHLPTDTENQPYNRSRVFNKGAKQALGELLILHDNDMMVPNCYLHNNWIQYQEGFQVINLKRFIFYLTKKHAIEICENKSISTAYPEFVLQNLTGGGSLAITKSGFEMIGGFDEEFVGWGGEDVEFWDRAQTLNVCNTGSIPILHLWHKPQPEKTNDKNSKAMQRLEIMNKIAIETRICNLRKQYHAK